MIACGGYKKKPAAGTRSWHDAADIRGDEFKALESAG